MDWIPPNLKRSIRDVAAFAIGAILAAMVSAAYFLWFLTKQG